MKTTVDIPDSIYRQIKARAALQGQTVRSFFLDAIREKLNASQRRTDNEPGWRSVFGKADKHDIAAVQKVIDEEFSRIDAEDWQ